FTTTNPLILYSIPCSAAVGSISAVGHRKIHHRFQPLSVFFKFAEEILLLPGSAVAAAIKLWSLLPLGLINELLSDFFRVAVLLAVIG
ncbi:hypothetical protein PIB30_086506, partial [Stylosanthes scabra]|nr:hypothetical protein [Stylosanthes scabra]